MKTAISLIILLTCISSYLPGQDIVDDVYFRPSDANKVRSTETVRSATKPNYKNGAKEIIFIDSSKDKNLIVTRDTVYILSQINDSIEAAQNNNQSYEEEEGYYVNNFRGSNSDLEYAERIRRFHNPKFTIHISDPQYTDIYFLDDYNWNVYVDGSYAWVTPTWTNPYWDNYFWRPYSYNSWSWRNSWYSPYSYYNSWYGNPWSYGHYGGYYGGGYGGYYGGYGSYYGGYGGWGYPYYNNYYWGSNWTGSSYTKNTNYNESTRRREYYSGSDASRTNVNTRISGGNNSQAVSRNVVVTSDRTGRNQQSTAGGTINRNTNVPVRGASNFNSNVRTSSNIRNAGIDTRTRTTNTNTVVRDDRSASTIFRGGTVVTPRSTSTVVNTNTRNTVTNQNNSSTVRTGTGTSNVRSSSTAPTRTNSSSTSTSTPSVRSGTPSYSAPSTQSSSSYSGSSRSEERRGGK